MSSILIKNKGPKALTLNESLGENKKFVFEGVFTQCGVENRNNRIYDPEEVLPHLAYLRDKIKNEGCILGELDHPEGRFEIYLKDASHKITDLWYDKNSKCVMGKLELLNTPNGKTIQAIVEAGCPLFVSSRAAGTVGPDKHVSIQQIFTYDIVAVPGFAEARLDQVNEAMRAQVMSFLNESKESQEKSKNLAQELGIEDEAVSVFEAKKDPEITAKKKSLSESELEALSKPINEDIKVKVSKEKAKELGLIGNSDETNAAPTDNQDASGEEEKKHTADEILGIVPKYEGQDKDFIKDIQPEFKSPESSIDANSASMSAAQPQQNNTQNIQMSESKGKTAYINLIKESCVKEEEDNNKTKQKYEEEIDLNEEGDDTPNPIADGKKGSDTDKVVASSHKKEEKEEKGGNDDKVDQKATSKNDKAEEQSEIRESKKIVKNKKINEDHDYIDSFIATENVFHFLVKGSEMSLENAISTIRRVEKSGKIIKVLFWEEGELEDEIPVKDIIRLINSGTVDEYLALDLVAEGFGDMYVLLAICSQDNFQNISTFSQVDFETICNAEKEYAWAGIVNKEKINLFEKLIMKQFKELSNIITESKNISIKYDKNLQRLENKKKEIKESTDRILGFYEHLIDGQDKIESIKESIVRQWPFSISLSEANFNKFATLSPEDKNKCADFIWKNQIFDIQQINETFMRPLSNKINEMKNYLRLASESDVKLYMNASPELKEAIDQQASFFVLESKEDVDEFWRRSGLREALNKQVQNESFVENYNKVMAENEDNGPVTDFAKRYGYDISFIEQVGRMM